MDANLTVSPSVSTTIESSDVLTSSFMVPVAVINACALVALALYNRLALLVGRVRTFNKEIFELELYTSKRKDELQKLGEEAEETRRNQVSLPSSSLSELQAHQTRKDFNKAEVDLILKRAKKIKLALLSLWGAIFSNVFTILIVGYDSFFHHIDNHSSIGVVITFSLTCLCVIACVFFASYELVESLQATFLETSLHEKLNALRRDRSLQEVV